MDELLQANIFFFIASVATVLFAILVSIILYQLYKITRAVRRIIERIEEGSETIREDLRDFRQTLSFTSVLLFAQRFFKRSTGSKKRQKDSHD